MRAHSIIWAVVLISNLSFAKERHSPPLISDHFEIGRRTYFDFGPPFDFYELFLIREGLEGAAIERITLTPAGHACIQPAKLELASGSIKESIVTLLGQANPCAIPKKALRRELKRCKKCLVFSGADVSMRFQCGSQNRVIRSHILDKDMFDAAPNTPKHTSWTIQLLAKIDQALGPGVMDRPVFDTTEANTSSVGMGHSNALQDLSSGKYDSLFQGAPHRPSDLYRAAQNIPTSPSIRLSSISPVPPEAFVEPKYPPLAKLARIEGTVVFKVGVDQNGNATQLVFESGHPILREAVKQVVSNWHFGKDAANQQVSATMDFKLNCSAEH